MAEFSYFWGLGFKSRPGQILSWYFVIVYSVIPGKNRRNTLN
jgi:hypothetical protein